MGSGDNPHGDDYVEFRSIKEIIIDQGVDKNKITCLYRPSLPLSREFRLLLQTLRQFFEYYQAFDRWTVTIVLLVRESICHDSLCRVDVFVVLLWIS